MTTKQAKLLLPRTVVMWNNDPRDLGTVLELGKSGFYVDWADGQCGWILYNNAQNVDIR